MNGWCEHRVVDSFVVGIQRPGGEVPLDSMDVLQTSVRHQSNSQDYRELPTAMGRMGQKSWLLLKDVFSMKHHNSEGFGPPAPDLVSPQGGLPCAGCGAAVALSGHFTHVHQSLK